jgi:hypothetical protein
MSAHFRWIAHLSYAFRYLSVVHFSHPSRAQFHHQREESADRSEVRWIIERIVAALREAPWDEEHLEKGKWVKVWFGELGGPYEDVEVIEVPRPGTGGGPYKSGEEMDEFEIMMF